MNYPEETLILVRLILAHLLTDFVVQPNSWVWERRSKKERSPKLYLHCLVTAAVAYLFAGLWTAWWLPLMIFISHLVIDIWKSYQFNSLRNFLTDQVLHLLVLVLLWIAAFDRWLPALDYLVSLTGNAHVLIIGGAYLTTAWPLGYLIGVATEKWRQDADVNREGLAKAGMWIGLLERFLILTFILIDQFTAVGLLIAAKSILRFSDKDNTQKKTEYVLIGTLMSFVASFVVGLLVRKLL